MSLSVPWPDAVRTLLAFASSLTSVSSHTSTVTCSATDQNVSQAEVYYGMLILSAFLPFAVMVITFFYWQVCAPCSKVFSCGRSLIRTSICPKENPFHVGHGSHLSVNSNGKVKRSTRDGWIVTNVLVLYIFIPSIVKISLEMCQWEKICGEYYWALDDTIKYDSPSHQFLIIAVAVPSILFYGVTLIILTMIYIGLHADRQTNKKLMFRFGLLFSGFSPQYWWYEIVLFFRKMGVIFIVTFASSNEQQLHIAMGLLVMLLYLQEHMRPFDNPEATDNAKIQSSKLHRMESFSMLVLIIMIWSAVFFVLGCNDHDGLCSVLGVGVIFINIVFIGVVVVVFVQAFSKQNKLGYKLSHRMSALTKSFQGSKTKTKRDTVDSTLFPTDGETKIKLNPLSKGKSKKEFKNERRSSGGGAGGNGSMTREVEMTETSIDMTETSIDMTEASIDISNVIMETLKDDNGRRYSWNKVTNETKWIDEQKNEPVASRTHQRAISEVNQRNLSDEKIKKDRKKRRAKRKQEQAKKMRNKFSTGTSDIDLSRIATFDKMNTSKRKRNSKTKKGRRKRAQSSEKNG